MGKKFLSAQNKNKAGMADLGPLGIQISSACTTVSWIACDGKLANAK